MIDWLLKNKEWVFSGVGVAMLIAAATAIKWFWHRHTSRSGLSLGMTLQEVIDSPPATPSSRPPETLPLEPQAIIKAIKSAPFLQQSDLAKHYVGIRVEWAGKLISAEKRENKVQLLLMTGHVGISFEVNPADYPGLGLLREDAAVRVSGIIESVNENFIKLKEPRLLTFGNAD